MSKAQLQPLQIPSWSRTALMGFFLSGLLLAFPGAILPAWGYHIRPNYATIGHYFLALNVGLLASVAPAGMLVGGRGVGVTSLTGAVLAAIAIIGLAFTSPPTPEIWRLPGFVALGCAAGTLNTAALHAISPAYRHEPAATVNLAGLFFGSGSLFVALVFSAMFNLASIPAMMTVLALVAGGACVAFARAQFPTETPMRSRTLAEVAHEFTIPSAVLFSLLLFFHFANEWSIAGWLPLFLIQRLGLSPPTAIAVLALYWLSLTVCRLISQSWLARFHHGKMLICSTGAALFGCLVLALTDNLFGALLGTLFVGMGFGPVYPLVVEKIGARFPHYHPGFFNGIFSLALTGGFVAPALVGYASEQWGVQILMVIPALGTSIVFFLVLLIWLESRLSSSTFLKSKLNRS